MAPLYPALLVGGPPHSGKSTLTYRLSAALNSLNIVHYVLRASPDGEGNWTTEGESELVRVLRDRAKQPWSDAFTDAVVRDVAHRHLPLLVDAGGRLSSETSRVMARCTHLLLLAGDLREIQPWREQAASHGLPLIGELRSALNGPQQREDRGPVLRGVISGLAAGASSDGPCFAALVERVAQIFRYDPEQLFRAHRALLHDIDLVLHVERPIHPLPAHDPYSRRWQFAELPILLASLPVDEPLAVYGRGPAWLVAALAAFSPTQRFALFDVRLGWVAPPQFALADHPAAERLDWRLAIAGPGVYQLAVDLPGGYLDYDDASDLPVPRLAEGAGVIIDGKLPNWLFAAIVRRYAGCAWVGVREPRSDKAVIIASRLASHQIGEQVSYTPALLD